MFQNRPEAGRRLADRLSSLKAQDAAVLGLPRGGVPVASEVARALSAPLDVVVVRKLGYPGQPELAIGAVADGRQPEILLNRGVFRERDLPPRYLDEEITARLRDVRELE